MNLRPQLNPLDRASRRGGFSVLEVIVVSALMAIIVFGLLLMFTQTQKAYRLGTTQVDVMEGGRATMDLIGRELAVMRPSDAPYSVNFLSVIPFVPGNPNYEPLRQPLPGNPSPIRTNVIQDVFFLTRDNQQWRAIGYYLIDRQAGMGTLMRFEATTHVANSPERALYAFQSLDLSDPNFTFNTNRVLDGVLHFRVRAYDTNGVWMTNDFAANTDVRWSTIIPGEIGLCRTTNNFVPASVELELGILESENVARARAIPVPALPAPPTTRSNYLAQHAGNVQLFRLRVPIRNVDPSAYVPLP